ncbi:DUF4013 domain-containing protein [Natrarchaeobaculum aegyptiacum]|uniref:DUF4013 domain-containing protein n=1 Tax=Natrarchaeobaculum aegyptiacum TaxID=745377 RepID=A0A2Z2HWE4_9EURY|nr:DUF4013 domain-containing protein [Natrarchaeobaculum aegyptiacum]ARS90475.1 hypothetical protein B1756_12545 [Natrarchaeobaculum aegyptiacum]
MSRLEDPLRYPLRGNWLERTLYGSALVVGSILLVPLVVLAGYGVRVLETSLEGLEEPPAFDGWGSLLRRGAGAIAITLAYLFGPLLAGTLLALALGVVGYYGLQGLVPVIGGETTIVWLVSGAAGLFTALVGLVVAGVVFVSWLCLPAGLVRYAQTGRLRASLDQTAVGSLVRTREYLGAVVVLQLLPLVVPLLAVVALVTIVGVLALPALGFLTVLVFARVLGVFLAGPGASQVPTARDAHLEQAALE